MSSRSLGTLTLDLVAKTGNFTAGLDKAARESEKRFKAMEASAKRAGTVIGGLIAAGATAAATAIAASTVAAINYADELDEMSQKLQISAEQLSKWGYAAKLSGTDLDGLSRGLALLSKNVAAAADSNSRQARLFDALGISIKDAEGNLRAVEELLPEIADRFRQLNNPTTETALAMQLFGKSGAELLEFLNRGGDGIDALGQELSDLGGVISNETAAASAEFKDNLDKLKASSVGFGAQVASGLLPAMNDLVSAFSDFIREGNLAANVASVFSAAIGAGISVVDGYNRAVERTSALMETLANASQGFAQIQRNLSIGGLFNEGSVAAGVKQVTDAFAEGDKALERIEQRSNRLFRNVRGSVSSGSQSQDNGLSDRVNAFLGNPTNRKPKKPGKTDEEKEAEALKRAYESMNERLSEQIALFGQTTEAARVRYEVENGGLKALEQAQKNDLVAKAARLDAMRDLEEAQDAADELVRRETEAYADRMESNSDLVKDMEFELSLLGMTNRERERAIALSYLSADATDADREAVSRLSEELRRANEQEQQWNEFKGTLSDAFFDVAMDAGNALEAVKNFFDTIAAQITRSIADNWAEKIGDILKGGGSSSSSGGNWFSNFLGALWGGGKASGGMALPGMMYEVNERGFEMASVGGRDYMMVGSQPVEITPNHQLGGGGGGTFNFQFAAPTSLKTQKQVANKVSYEQRRARGYA